ncbi:hypothetical protein QBC36DRAFT_193674 [Triangularia setosa]|uniref:Uncharacterized protein n=1 Tax=Triangularia setosa TaxID=2587417 RepID=A0AAN6W1X8_9PEZI|nr:hypothetical protein QBC36DRAFT_193674 [Podospora setosa]
MGGNGTSKAGVWFLGREFALICSKESMLSLPVNPGNPRTNSWKGTVAPSMWVFNAAMLHDAIWGPHTLVFTGLSPDITMKHNGTHIIPWGRIRPGEGIVPRRDLLRAMKPVEERELGYAAKLWEWCESQWNPYLQEEVMRWRVMKAWTDTWGLRWIM